MTPEAKVKASLVKGLDELEMYWFFPATHGYGRSGVPDIIACAYGMFFAFECKAGSNSLTLLQEAEIGKIRAAGGHAYVVRESNVETTLLTLECLLGKKRDDRRRGTAKADRKGAARTRLRPD